MITDKSIRPLLSVIKVSTREPGQRMGNANVIRARVKRAERAGLALAAEKRRMTTFNTQFPAPSPEAVAIDPFGTLEFEVGSSRLGVEPRALVEIA
jgi:hypothetical protein